MRALFTLDMKITHFVTAHVSPPRHVASKENTKSGERRAEEGEGRTINLNVVAWLWLQQARCQVSLVMICQLQSARICQKFLTKVYTRILDSNFPARIA